jgi:hypothetical protein
VSTSGSLVSASVPVVSQPVSAVLYQSPLTLNQRERGKPGTEQLRLVERQLGLFQTTETDGKTGKSGD